MIVAPSPSKTAGYSADRGRKNSVLLLEESGPKMPMLPTIMIAEKGSDMVLRWMSARALPKAAIRAWCRLERK